MGKTIVSVDGRFEWDEEKDRQNINKHGFSFSEILEVFDDPVFLEGFDLEHSDREDRYYGIGCLNNVVHIVVFYTERGIRKRIFSARQADADDKELYDDYFRQTNG
jgi:uncharacterized DUF497 family protein